MQRNQLKRLWIVTLTVACSAIFAWFAPPLKSSLDPMLEPTLESDSEPLFLVEAVSAQVPDGFKPLFNGKDLSGWKGLVGDPLKRAAMTAEQLAAAQAASDAEIAKHWRAESGEIVNDGHGPHLCTTEDYGDFELMLEWKISKAADSGIYLRGSPQVQIWDPVNGIDQAKVGSGALYNNQKNPSKPPAVADRAAGEWNSLRILMVGERVSVDLNGVRTVDDVVMENYWDRNRPIDPIGQIELQTHDGEIRFRKLYLRKIEPDAANAWLEARAEEGFVELFDGKSMEGWQGATDGYVVEDGLLRCKQGHGGNLLTCEEFADFVLRFQFRLERASNNGLAIRAPAGGNPAYAGMELQILDTDYPGDLEPWQLHGSVYGVFAAQRGYLRPARQWNYQEVHCRGSHVQVFLNGTCITDVDLATITQPIDGQDHPGIRRDRGYLGFMGHNDPVDFRNIAIREM